jgi:protein SCO1/2
MCAAPPLGNAMPCCPSTFRRVALPLVVACLATLAKAEPVDAPVASAPLAAAPLPADSIYQLAVPLTDQNGRNFALQEHRGHPLLISMFYTSCQFVCPMLIDALRDTEAKLENDKRQRLSILMVSFDPAHDSVAVLKRTADQRQLDSAHWTLARTDPQSVRKLAAVLGIQYRALANGDYNHTTALILIDAQGRIAGRTAQLGNADPAFVKLVKAATQATPR